MLIGCSTLSIDSNLGLTDKLKMIKKAGFPFVGICAQDFASIENPETIKKVMSELQLGCTTCHCSTIIDINNNPEQTLELLGSELLKASKIGCKIFVIAFPVNGTSELSQIYIYNILKRILPVSCSYNTIIGIENINLASVKGIEKTIKEINSPFVRAVFSIGGCTNNQGNVQPEAAAQGVNILNKSIIEIHVSDADEVNTHLLPGKGKTAWIKLGLAILRLKYRGYWMLEGKNSEPSESLVEGMDFIYKFVGKQRVAM
jgi:sugar phosphate isomerase/epimerase